MLNSTDPAALTFQTESPLSKLVEHCNKFGHDSKSKLEKLETVRTTTTESLLLPPEMNPYANYSQFIPTTNWLDQTNWQWAYPTATTDAYSNYLNPLNGLFTQSAAVASQAAVAAQAQSLVPRPIPNLKQKPTNGSSTSLIGSSSASSSSTTNSQRGSGTSAAGGGGGGGKYPSTSRSSNCECPNCQELERVGLNNIAARKRGVHNCHIAGCGKVYNKSSHLKAHLRWHSGERPTRRRSGDAN